MFGLKLRYARTKCHANCRSIGQNNAIFGHFCKQQTDFMRGVLHAKGIHANQEFFATKTGHKDAPFGGKFTQMLGKVLQHRIACWVSVVVVDALEVVDIQQWALLQKS